VFGGTSSVVTWAGSSAVAIERTKRL